MLLLQRRPRQGCTFMTPNSCLLNTLLQSAVTLLDILDCMSFVRTHLRGERGSVFQCTAVAASVEPPCWLHPGANGRRASLNSIARSTLAGSERKAFNNDVRALVESRYGRQPFDLQLETKVYVLEKVRLRVL